MDFSKELAQLQELLYFKMNLLQAEIEMNAMIAENKKREQMGQPIANNEKLLMNLIEEHKIYHNAFPFYRG